MLLAQHDIRGFSAAQAQAERELEAKALAIPHPERLRAYMERMSAEPHIAGSPRPRLLPIYALGLFREWGLDTKDRAIRSASSLPQVSTARNDRSREVQREARRAGARSRTAIPATRIRSRRLTRTRAMAMLPDTGVCELRRSRGLRVAGKLGIDVKGKIVMARYGKSWRGTKAKVAQEHGAIALPDLFRSARGRILPGRRLSAGARSVRRMACSAGVLWICRSIPAIRCLLVGLARRAREARLERCRRH